MSVTVVRDRYTRGWPRHEHGDPGYVVSLGYALAREYSTDAHFAAYHTPNSRRLTREALDVLDAVSVTCIVFDVDCQDVHGTGEPAPESWRREARASMESMLTRHPGGYYYETRGGARIAYRLPEPAVLMCQEDACRWSQDYAIAVAYLSRRFAIEADPACCDWQRLFRLPRATRKAGGQPENWYAMGDPHAIGALTIEATDDDIAAAKRASKAFSRRRVLDVTPCSSTGVGLLYELLRARGDLIREHHRGGYVVRCPAEHEHTSGRTGDGSTVLYPPASAEQLGAIHCFHAHCTHRRARDWLSLFSQSELEAARRSLGIARAA